MADTLNAVVVGTDQYYSLNVLTGVPVGTEITLQNQGDSVLAISIGAVEPTSGTKARRLVPADIGFLAYIAAGSSEVWVKGIGGVTDVHVEVV